jgi:hypothetical protein
MTEEEKQTVTIFKPSATEKKLLDVILDPEFATLSICEICKRAGVSRPSYYRAFERPEFTTYYGEQTDALVQRAFAPIVNACVKKAVGGSAPHAKIILTMGGKYTEKTDHRILDKNGVAQTLGGLANMTDKEIEDELARYNAIREATQA